MNTKDNEEKPARPVSPDAETLSPSQVFLNNYGETLSGIFPEDQTAQAGQTPVITGLANRERFWDKYEILEKLGQGGMGVVYLVKDRTLQRKVAMKVLSVQGPDQEIIKRFLVEAVVTGRLGHPNIPPLYEVGEWPGTGELYYTMQYIKGSTLAQLIKEVRAGQRDLTYLRRAQIILDVCRALSFAHSQGIINRDIKPANIILEGETGIVLDWGLAKIIANPDDPLGESEDFGGLGQGLTAPGMTMGTPHYMSPEQAAAEREKLGPWSDIYSLGATLYELLALRLPFVLPPFANRELWLEIIITTEPLPLRRDDSSIPLELERICSQAMKKEIGERYARIEDLMHDLQRYIEGEQKLEEVRQKLGEAGERIRAYNSKTAEVREIETALESVAKKATEEEVTVLKDRLEDAEGTVEDAFLAALEASLAALSLKPRPEDSAPVLGEFFQERLIRAEQEKKRREIIAFKRHLAEVDDGRFTVFLRNEGTLRVISNPRGAWVVLFRYEEEGKKLAPVFQQDLGIAPIPEKTLPMGSYLLVLNKPGYRQVRCPVFLERALQEVVVNLYTDEAIGQGFIYVPAGPAIIGGDIPEAPGSKHWARVLLPDFFIGEFPVTCAEYAEFLSAVGRINLAVAGKMGPRESGAATHWLWDDETRQFIVPQGDERKPITGISWKDARVYVTWRSKKDGRKYLLPEEDEWEKAARGVDGRYYPWGDRFDRKFLNCRQNIGALLPIGDSPPEDTSPYGVREMAGNAREWTKSKYPEDPRHRVIRSGAFVDAAGNIRLANRRVALPDAVMGPETFRLVVHPIKEGQALS